MNIAVFTCIAFAMMLTLAPESTKLLAASPKLGSVATNVPYEHRTLQLSQDGETASIEDFVVRRSGTDVRIVDLLSLNLQTYTLASAADVLAPFILIDSGASAGGSSSLPSAVGLVMTVGKIVSPLSQSQFASGVFCILADGTAIIARSGSFGTLHCSSAVQSGPLIVEPNRKIGIGPNDLKRRDIYAHSLAALERDGTLHLMWTTPVHLYHLARFLLDHTSVQSVINLGAKGGVFTRVNGATKSFGNVQSSIAAAIGVFPR